MTHGEKVAETAGEGELEKGTTMSSIANGPRRMINANPLREALRKLVLEQRAKGLTISSTMTAAKPIEINTDFH